MDRGKEYEPFLSDFRGKRVDKSYSPPYPPEVELIAERINRTLIESTRAVLIEANLLLCLWPYALEHVVYVRNGVQNSTTGMTPYSIVTYKRPTLKHVRTFGCTGYVLGLPCPENFEPSAHEGVLLELM